MNHLDDIKAFVKVAELGSYTRAAEALDLSRTRVSRQVMALEEALGARLIQRTTRRLHLTEAGERYLARAQGILLALEEAAAEVSSGTCTVSGWLRINGPMSFGTRYLAPQVARFMQAHPGLDVRLDLNDRRVDLLEEGYDLAIRIGSLPDSSLIAKRLTRCQLVFCASPEYLAQHGTPTRIEDLSQHRCLRYRSGQNSGHWYVGKQTLAVSGRAVGADFPGGATDAAGDSRPVSRQTPPARQGGAFHRRTGGRLGRPTVVGNGNGIVAYSATVKCSTQGLSTPRAVV